MSLIIISIPLCANNTRTSSSWPWIEAQINGVLLNVHNKLHKSLSLRKNFI